jgi:hypothetical protein
LNPVGGVAPEGATAGPVPIIVWPLTLAALLTTAKSETSTVAAIMMLIKIRLWFIRFPFLEVLRLKKKYSKEQNGGVAA